jgi:hypothetical protein
LFLKIATSFWVNDDSCDANFGRGRIGTVLSGPIKTLAICCYIRKKENRKVPAISCDLVPGSHVE